MSTCQSITESLLTSEFICGFQLRSHTADGAVAVRVRHHGALRPRAKACRLPHLGDNNSVRFMVIGGLDCFLLMAMTQTELVHMDW